MRIVHLADSHLGFSTYSRLDQYGLNRIEKMVYEGFDQAVDEIIRAHPAGVVHAGDVFHHVRPKIKPLVVFQKGLQRLTEAGIPVIIISGNHDAPKSYSLTSPFRLFEDLRDVYIAQRYRYEHFEIGDYSFHCIPFCLDPKDYVTEFQKIKRSGRDVLVLHGLVESLKYRKMRSVGEHELNDSLLKGDFDYIALGHFHGQIAVSANAWYSGSIEYFNFGEANDKKGMLMVDLEKGRVENMPIKQKYMIDYPDINCEGLASQEISECLMGICQDDNIKDKMVRITLKNVNRSVFRSLDQGKLNKLGASALYFKIKPQFLEVSERLERPIDRWRLHEEFTSFLHEVSSRKQIPVGIEEDVISYGSELILKVTHERSSETIDASQ